MIAVEESIRDIARKMAQDNRQASPDLEAVYWFPHDREIRLVEIDPITLSSDRMVPYYFGAYPQGGISYPSAIVLIRPEEKFVLLPPPEWGSWDTAIQLWPENIS